MPSILRRFSPPIPLVIAACVITLACLMAHPLGVARAQGSQADTAALQQAVANVESFIQRSMSRARQAGQPTLGQLGGVQGGSTGSDATGGAGGSGSSGGSGGSSGGGNAGGGAGGGKG